jgi:hypothetical protein
MPETVTGNTARHFYFLRGLKKSIDFSSRDIYDIFILYLAGVYLFKEDAMAGNVVRKSGWFVGLFVGIIFGMFLFPSGAAGQTTWYWIGNVGDWSVAENWDDGAGNPGIPQSGDDVIVDLSDGIVTFDYNYSDAGLGYLTIDQGAQIVQDTNRLAVDKDLRIGDYGYGLFIQNGGTHDIHDAMILGGDTGAYGEYALTGGNLTVGGTDDTDPFGWTAIGDYGEGVFYQTGGTFTAHGTYDGLVLGNNDSAVGTYNLENGTLDVLTWEEKIGNDGTGYFNQDGGTHLFGTIYMGDNETGYGRYVLNDGELTGGGLCLGEWGGTGDFLQYGGTVTVNDLILARQNFPVASHGNYELQNGTLTANYIKIAERGIGTFTQSGGLVTVNNDLILATVSSGEGTYTLFDGTLTVNANTIVGHEGFGTFNQEGGIHDLQNDNSNLFIGHCTGGAVRGEGVYNLTGGTLSAWWIGVGNGGTGTFNQTGGDVEARMDLVLAQGGGSSGTYNLDDGSIHSFRDGYFGAGGVGNFIQKGGSVVIDSTLVIGWTDGDSDGEAHYSLQDGTLDVGAGEVLAARGVGTFEQTGGNHTVNYDLSIAETPGTAGRFNLAGGSLTVGGNLRNYDQFNYSGGNLDADIVNYAAVTLSGAGTRIVNGTVANEAGGTFNVTGTSAVFTETFVNKGAYISDPSTQTFTDLEIADTGYLVGGEGDQFRIANNLLNQSQANTLWDTTLATLAFIVGDDNAHDASLTGADLGPDMNGYVDNFAWGIVDLTDNVLALFDGNTDVGGALYTKQLRGAELSDFQVVNIIGQPGLNVYYLPADPANAYLNGLTYDLTDGGQLIPIPEPAVLMLLVLGGLFFLRRRSV